MKISKRFVCLVALSILTSLNWFEFSTDTEVVQAKPHRGHGKPQHSENKPHHGGKKPKHHQQTQHSEDDEDDNQELERGENGPPPGAPAWGYRCNHGEDVEHPGNRQCKRFEEHEDDQELPYDGWGYEWDPISLD